MPITFSMPSNRSVALLLSGKDSEIGITAGDLLFAIERQKSRILDRTTVRFVDYNEQPFAPYDESRPYYYYPQGKTPSSAGHKLLDRLGKRLKGSVRTRTGLKFESYAAFKRSLGRLGVDLLGPSAPHMLQKMVVQVNGVIIPVTDTHLGAYSRPASEVTLGIYNTSGAIAASHNDGLHRMPQREFFAISTSDADDILNDIQRRMRERMRH